MRWSTARWTAPRSPEYLWQPDRKAEVALKRGAALEDRNCRVDRAGADTDEIGERDPKLDRGVVGDAPPRMSPVAGDLDRPGDGRRPGGWTPELV
jgi:hypothetical protein